MVIGEGRRFLSALLALEEEAAARFAAEHGIDGPLHEDERLLAELQRGVDEVNNRLARVESVRQFRVLPRPLTLDDGELTPTLKLRRREIEANWAAEIDGMYG